MDLRHSFDKCANIIIWIVYPKEDQDIDVDLKNADDNICLVQNGNSPMLNASLDKNTLIG